MAMEVMLQKHNTQSRIFNVIKSLENLPKTAVTREPDFSKVRILHPHQYVPNFLLIWCGTKRHYRVYIEIASTSTDKVNAGYPICTISSNFVAAGFCALYGFLHKHRSNNKEQ